MARIALDILRAVSFHLVERMVKTSLGVAVAAAGVATVTPPEMRGIFAGALLLVARGTGVEEVVTVTSTTVTQFTATFAFAHAAADTVDGATFSSGATDHFLWTTTEMLNYLAEAQQEFLTATRSVYSTASDTVLAAQRVYTKPVTAIRVEHLSIDNAALRYVSQEELDLGNRLWPADTGIPRAWFEDRLDPNLYGYNRIPQVGGSVALWFSARGAVTLALNTALTVPDVCAHALTYGTLSRCWSKAGEGADPTRAKYSAKRFDAVVALTQRLVGDLQLVAQGAPNKFPTFAVPRS